MPISPRHFARLRWLSLPAVLALGAAVAWLGTEVLGWQTPVEIGLLLLFTLLAALSVLLLYRRIERQGSSRAQVARRELGLAERERGLDRLHHGIGKLRGQPGHGRWLALAERLRIADPAVIDLWERRYQQLRADPRRRAWSEQALKGNFLGDLQIDYLSDPHMLLTCEHLQALETVLRGSGIPCRALAEGAIACDASLQPARIRKHFLLADCVEWVVDQPSPHQKESVSALVCQHCHSRIESGHGPAFPDRKTDDR